MNFQAPCLVYSRNDALSRRLCSFLPAEGSTVHPARDVEDVLAMLDQYGPSVVILDSCEAAFRTLFERVRAVSPESRILVVGTERTEPVISACEHGAYAVLRFDFAESELLEVSRHAQEALVLSRMLSTLRRQRETATDPRPASPAAAPPQAQGRSTVLRNCFPPLRRFEDVQALLQGIVDSIVEAGVVLRIGIFAWDEDEGLYRFRAGVGCSDETRRIRVSFGHDLLRWLRRHAQILCRSELAHAGAPDEQVMLEHALDLFGAELLVPLQGRDRIIGWIFLGRLVDGTPYHPADLQDVIVLADRISMALENAILYLEASRQRQFAETLLHTVPAGVVAVDMEGRIRWCNEAATRMFAGSADRLLLHPAEALGSRIAHLLRETIAPDGIGPHRGEWMEPGSERYLRVESVRLAGGGRTGGAVAIVHDLTEERKLGRKQRDLDRSSFWTELAASMSHEIRNPLVAIKTFAQLLPERYEDTDFRTEFSVLVTQEVDRLNSLIEQINRFAHLPRPVYQTVDLRDVVSDGIRLATTQTPESGVRMQTVIAPALPKIKADRRALTEALGHLVSNALEALEGRPNGSVTVSARTAPGDETGNVEIAVRDNGSGIDPQIRDKIFSPFFSTRQKGMGLGLAITQRTVADHDGQIQVESNGQGTCVTIVLPPDPARAAEERYEATVDC